MTWFDVGYNAWKTYPIEDYNDSLAQTHNLASDYDLSKEWVQQFVQSVMQDCDRSRGGFRMSQNQKTIAKKS